MSAPTLAEIRAARERLKDKVRVTPTLTLPMGDLDRDWPGDADAIFKLELFQVTGTFKARGALNGMLALSEAQRAKGVTAVSAGNHAVAVAYAAQALGLSARVVMIKTANPLRVELAKSFGADVEFAEHGAAAFERVKEIETKEGRFFVHPFEGPGPVTGTATLGLEWIEQAPGMDAVVIACGGGGLLAGVAAAIKQASPSTQVFGVEPEGADNMYQSFEKGEPAKLAKVATIADSLGPPYSTPYTFGVCKQYVDRMVLVSDDAIRDAMRLSLRVLKLAVEPAGAAALAGVLGPLRDALRGKKRIGILVCGANIDAATFCKLVSP
ncbi:MAG TPA: pyridoxal-phosphate dependent enzyme [Burkholderiales bacterium]|nr:pyridoxal-phosphate dependent enzyme [Burkholderiales bacterium]